MFRVKRSYVEVKVGLYVDLYRKVKQNLMALIQTHIPVYFV